MMAHVSLSYLEFFTEYQFFSFYRRTRRGKDFKNRLHEYSIYKIVLVHRIPESDRGEASALTFREFNQIVNFQIYEIWTKIFN